MDARKGRSKRGTEDVKDNPNQNHPSKRLWFDNAATVTLFVGPEKTKYVLPLAILVNGSSFFKVAFDIKRGFREGTERELDLDHLDVEVFDAFLCCLHNPSVWCENSLWQEMKSRNTLTEDLGWEFLCNLYLTADYLQSSCVKHVALSELRSLAFKSTYLPSSTIVNKVYENTVSGAGIRRLLVLQRIWRCQAMLSLDENEKKRDELMDDELGKFCPQFLGEVAGMTIRHINSGSKKNWFKAFSAWEYHGL